MTQEKAANLIHIAPRTYFAKEHGKSDFTLKRGSKTSKILQNNSGRAV